jgi:hypothetical protein
MADKGRPHAHVKFIILKLFCLLFCSFHVNKPSPNGSADMDDLLVKRRGLIQGIAIWGFINISTQLWELFPKKAPLFGEGIGISSLNALPSSSVQLIRIKTLNSSKSTSLKI